MYTLFSKMALIVFSMALGAYQLYQQEPVNGFFLLLMAGILIFDHLQNGVVWLAHQKIRNGNYVSGEKIMRRIRQPHKLPEKQRAYYYFNYGLIELNNTNYDEAEKHLKKALAFSFKSENDQAVLHLKLASVYHQKQQPEQALSHLEESKKLFLFEMQKTETLDWDRIIVQNISDFQKTYKKRFATR